MPAKPSPIVVKRNAPTPVVHVAERPKVILVEGKIDAGRRLAESLRSGGLEVTRFRTGDIPATREALEPYRVVALVNVPAAAVPSKQAALLRDYVRISGGGLVVIGGRSGVCPRRISRDYPRRNSTGRKRCVARRPAAESGDGAGRRSFAVDGRRGRDRAGQGGDAPHD